jgi:hypothetical protein
MIEILHKKVSPPFEGGVVGMIDYLIYTVFDFPTGVVDSLVFQEPEFVKNEIRKSYKREDPELE